MINQKSQLFLKLSSNEKFFHKTYKTVFLIPSYPDMNRKEFSSKVGNMQNIKKISCLPFREKLLTNRTEQNLRAIDGSKKGH